MSIESIEAIVACDSSEIMELLPTDDEQIDQTGEPLLATDSIDSIDPKHSIDSDKSGIISTPKKRRSFNNMPTVDPRVDAYIEKSAEFAKPILTHIRKLVHKTCPEITETMKWSFPHFDYKGTVCSMASFKQHCAFGFWKQVLLQQDAFPAEKAAMGSFGRITSAKDLPSDKVMIGLIQQAIELNEKGIKVAKKPAVKKTLVAPKDLSAALSKNKTAKATFDKFSQSRRNEYIAWIEEAKTGPTRNKRLATTVEWLSEGKARNWKYENC